MNESKLSDANYGTELFQHAMVQHVLSTLKQEDELKTLFISTRVCISGLARPQVVLQGFFDLSSLCLCAGDNSASLNMEVGLWRVEGCDSCSCLFVFFQLSAAATDLEPMRDHAALDTDHWSSYGLVMFGEDIPRHSMY